LPVAEAWKPLFVLIHRVSDNAEGRKLSFRCREFSETQYIPLLILGNPICRVFLCKRTRAMRDELPLCGVLGNSAARS